MLEPPFMESGSFASLATGGPFDRVLVHRVVSRPKENDMRAFSHHGKEEYAVYLEYCKTKFTPCA